MAFDGLFVHFVMCSSCRMEFALPPTISLHLSLSLTQFCLFLPLTRLRLAHPPLLFYYPTFPLLLFRPNGDNEVCCSKCQYIEWATVYFTITIHIAWIWSQLFRSRIKFSNFSSHQQTKSNTITHIGAI